MLHRFRSLIIATGLGVLLSSLAAPATVGAIELFDDCTGASSDTALCKATGSDDATSLAQQLINVFLLLVGIVSVIMIVLGGFNYVVSNGDANKIAAAKNTILYSVIGLIVAILASAIVNFVVDQFS